ncbi:unnamed protein product [Coregonus sp. 'balchen']|nr:unnamed protein product [Coregonus sp. 'balchen']
MSYHQGAEGGAIPKERQKDGSPNKDLDETMDPEMRCTCTISYCETHIRQHYTIAALQRHTVVDVTGYLVQKLCQHDYSPLEVFCRTDQMLICSQCAETNHKGHDTILLKIKKAGRQVAPVLPPPGDIQVLLLTSNSVYLSWSSPQGVKGPHKFRVTWECDGETSSSRVKAPEENPSSETLSLTSATGPGCHQEGAALVKE